MPNVAQTPAHAAAPPFAPTEAQINRDLLGPLFKTGPKYYIALAVLLAVTGVVFVAWFFQLAYGIGMAGKNRPSFWGLRGPNRPNRHPKRPLNPHWNRLQNKGQLRRPGSCRFQASAHDWFLFL